MRRKHVSQGSKDSDVANRTKTGRIRKHREVSPQKGYHYNKGQPAFVPTPEQRHTVTMLVASTGGAITQRELCEAIINPSTGLPIALVTLHNNFREDIQHGQELANNKVKMTAYRMATGYEVEKSITTGRGKAKKTMTVKKFVPPDPTMVIWYEKTRCGLNEKAPKRDPNDPGDSPTVVIVLPANGRNDKPITIEGKAKVLLPDNGR